MKKKLFGRLGAAAVALTLITTCMMSGTLAKYTSSANGTVTVEAAKWAFSATDGTNPITTDTAISLGTTTTENITTGKIAPGSKGTFKVKVDNSASDVRAEYSITVAKGTDTGNLLDRLTFTDETGAAVTLGTAITGELGYGAAVDKDKEVTINWEWKYDAAADAADTTIGAAENTATINVTITGTQLAAEATTP